MTVSAGSGAGCLIQLGLLGLAKAKRAATVAEFLKGLSPERRKTIEATRALVRKNIDKGFKEGFAWGAIMWSIPLSVLPDTYNGQPLGFCAIGAHKSYCTLYLMSAYGDKKQKQWLADEFRKAGKRFDMGGSCLHFESMDDLVPEAVATVVASRTAKQWAEMYQRTRQQARGTRHPS